MLSLFSKIKRYTQTLERKKKSSRDFKTAIDQSYELLFPLFKQFLKC